MWLRLIGVFQVIQLTALRPSADLFCALLRDALKIELQRGQMKAVKTFVRTCYSEALLATSSNVAATEREDGSLIKADEPGGEGALAGTDGPAYYGGLGLKFKFPGDPKKLREASKTKLWMTYLRSGCSSCICACGHLLTKLNVQHTVATSHCCDIRNARG
jgi:hypothetical protein